MQISEMKKISISNLILIILNDENNDITRKCAEVELRKRIQNVDWEYDDLLHFDDKVINKRGLNVDNYLISKNVNMQQLMEVYFTYDWKTDYYSNYLLFSEKHLCNEADFFEPFFGKMCNREIINLNKRIEQNDLSLQKETLLLFRNLLEERNRQSRQEKLEIFKDDPIELLCHNSAMYHLDGDPGSCFELFKNINDEKMYKLLSSKIGVFKIALAEILTDSLFDLDLFQYLYGLMFVKKDSSKLSYQKRKLLREVRSGTMINYETDVMKKVLQRIDK